MIFCKNRQSHFVWANKAYRDYYDKSHEQLHEVVSLPCPVPEYPRQYVKDDAHVFTTGTPLNLPEELLVRADGVAHPFHTVKAPIFNADGAVSMLVGVLRDSAERKIESSFASTLQNDRLPNKETLASETPTFSPGIM